MLRRVFWPYFGGQLRQRLRLPGNVQTLALSSESLDLTRRTDLARCAPWTDFVLEHCTEDQTVYINMDSNGYSGTTFAYSDPAHPQLQTMILWESSVPSTHGFPTGIWTSEYVMVTDRVDECGIVGPIKQRCAPKALLPSIMNM